jgi:pimeloyl-ACP methyl ester carboxylesterase
MALTVAAQSGTWRNTPFMASTRWIALSALLVSLSAHAQVPGEQTIAPHGECAALSALKIPAEKIGKPTMGAVIESATLVAAGATGTAAGAMGGADVEYCKVVGLIKPVDRQAPDIEFEVNMPTAWNARALQMGGGGYDGVLVTGLGPFSNQPVHLKTPLDRGYVTLGSDSGHKGVGFSGAFALNDEALMNYGRLSVGKTHDAALAVILAYYGTAPKHFYFIGGSQGGHEALIAAALSPDGFDGVVADYPAYNITLLQLSGVQIVKALYGNGGAGWLNPSKTKLLTDAVYAACDKLDGAEDGLISNVRACNAVFTMKTVHDTLRCPNGADTGDTCLSDAQIASVQAIDSPYVPGYLVGGIPSFPKWPILDGGLFSTNGTLGQVKQPSDPPSGKEAFQYSVASGITRYFITRDPSFDPLTFDASKWKTQTQHSGEIVDISSDSLRPFQARGGKMIIAHGTIDDLVSPYNSINYYNHQLAEFGQPALDGFLRFYVIPGFGHGRGLFNATYDSLGILDAWVSKGEAPGRVVATDGNKGATRTRPMCLYPTYPKFTGAAGTSVDDEANFTCVQP